MLKEKRRKKGSKANSFPNIWIFPPPNFDPFGDIKVCQYEFFCCDLRNARLSE